MGLCTHKAASAWSHGTTCPGDTASRHLSPHFPHHQLLNAGRIPSMPLHGHKTTGDAAALPRPPHGAAARAGGQCQMMGEQVPEGGCPHLSEGQAPRWLP